MNPEHENHTRLRKRDSEVTTISTPTYAGEYIDKVSNLYSSPGARNNFGNLRAHLDPGGGGLSADGKLCQ